MRCVMVIFSSVTLSKKLADCAIKTALEEDSKLLLVEIRSGNIPRKVALMAEERGFMGKEMVDQLEKEISKERQDVIDRRLGELRERLEKEGIEHESIVLESASIRQIIDIAREKDVTIIIAEKRLEDIGEGKTKAFEVIRVKE